MKTKMKTEGTILTHLWWLITLTIIRVKVFTVWTLKIAFLIVGVYYFWRGVFWLLHAIFSAIVFGGHH